MRMMGKADFFLMDLAFFSDGLAMLYREDPNPAYIPLYQGTPYQSVMLEGPVLIPAAATAAYEKLEEHAVLGDLIAVGAPGVSLEELAEHFRTWLRVVMPDGTKSAFRFADPRLYAALSGELTEEECARLLGPADWLEGKGDDRHWTLAAPSGAHPDPVAGVYPLRPELLNALQDWRFQTLMGATAERLGVTRELLAQWYRALAGAGAASEHHIIQACEQLASHGFQSELTPGDAQRATVGEMDTRSLSCWADQVSRTGAGEVAV